METLINDMNTATSRMSRIRQRAGSLPAGYSVVFASDVEVCGGRACVILHTLLQNFLQREVRKSVISCTFVQCNCLSKGKPAYQHNAVRGLQDIFRECLRNRVDARCDVGAKPVPNGP